MESTTEKIRVAVNTTQVKELEITFPYFTKNGGLYCKFLSKDKSICVYDYSFDKAVKYSSAGVPDSWITNDPITEEEFNAKFSEVMNALISINNEKAI